MSRNHYTDHFLQGPEDGMDAVFRHFESGEVRIAAILSERESVDEELNAKAARRIWATLVERGWTRVAQGRRTLHQIRVALMDAE